MDAGELSPNLFSSEDENDLCAELQGLQDCSSNNSNEDIQPLSRGKPTLPPFLDSCCINWLF